MPTPNSTCEGAILKSKRTPGEKIQEKLEILENTPEETFPKQIFKGRNAAKVSFRVALQTRNSKENCTRNTSEEDRSMVQTQNYSLSTISGGSLCRLFRSNSCKHFFLKVLLLKHCKLSW